MDTITLLMAMQQPEMLPLLLILDSDDEPSYTNITDVEIDTTGVDFTQATINIDAIITPADADIESAQVIATSKNYSAKLMYDEVNTKHVLQLDRTIDADSACEVYVQVDAVDVLSNLENSSNYFTFTYDQV